MSSTTVESSFPVDYSVHSRPKRKLDDYAPNFDGGHEDDDSDNKFDLVSVRMRKNDPNAVDQSSDLKNRRDSDGGDVAAAAAQVSSQQLKEDGKMSQLVDVQVSQELRTRQSVWFSLMWHGKSIQMEAKLNDTVKSIHEQIHARMRIPVMEQRLIYGGKQLQWELSLADYRVERDARIELVGRMRSTRNPQAWQVLDNLTSIFTRLCKGETMHSSAKIIKNHMTTFFSMTPKDNEPAICHLQTFMQTNAPNALVMLYISPWDGNRECADSTIRHFLNSSTQIIPKPLNSHCAPIVLEFCKLLRMSTPEDALYLACRYTLGSLLEEVGKTVGLDEIKGLLVIRDIYPFVSELAGRLSRDLVSSMELVRSVGPMVSDVRDFTAFCRPLCEAIRHMGFKDPISVPLPKGCFSDLPLYRDEIEQLHAIFIDLLKKMDKCLGKVEDRLNVKPSGEVEINYSGWSQYLIILRQLYDISSLYQGTEEQFWKVLRRRKSSLCALIMRYAKLTDDHKLDELEWLLRHNDVTNFESRRHLAMMMFPDVREDYEELQEMLIDRSQLLPESFEYIRRASREALHGGLFMEFKNEEATGPGVLREWFFLVCQAIFNPERALFVACPNDRRRFCPNPASKVDPMHLEYFKFSGRVIALALMHKVQVGVVFDRVFFLQLAGGAISLEDIQDADPFLYSSCKQILEMDADFIDSDGLGLTFVREVEELGSRKIVELCSGGKRRVVNSKNRKEYVNLLIQHRFVTSISEQAYHFAQGFADILFERDNLKLFFQSLKLEDLDWMLCGSESAICVEDWKAHTEYNGYKENDPEILWFWEIVGGMSAEQRKDLLFFWTSVKYLPIEGFRGLASRLYIYKSVEPSDHLPTSHTCFYRLCFPPYPSKAVMKDRLYIITQQHVGCSFGTW